MTESLIVDRRATDAGGWRAREWRRPAVCVSVVLAAPILALAALPPGHDRLAVVDTEAWLVLNLCLLAGSAMLYLRWRITDESSVAWLASAGIALAVAGTPPAMVDLAAGGHPGSSGRLSAVVLLAPVVLYLLYAARGTRFPQRLHPLTIGGALGLGGLAALVVGSTLPVGALPPPAQTILVSTAVVTGIALLSAVLALAARRGLMTPAPLHLAAISASLLTAALYPAVGSTPGVIGSSFVALPFALLGACLANSGAVLLLEALAEQSRALLDPRPGPEATRSQRASRDAEIFHELRATLADIASASHVLRRHDVQLSPERKERLERMLDVEMSRLGRLVADRKEPPPTEPVPLDDVVAPMVEGLRAQGHDVHWTSTGCTVLGRTDDVAEILHILLANARRHAPGTPTTVSAAERGDQVDLTVSDLGPGVPPALAPRVFDRGVRGDDSPGQGIGLHAAQRLAREHGGHVWLRAHPRAGGATFVVTLPRAVQEVTS